MQNASLPTSFSFQHSAVCENGGHSSSEHNMCFKFSQATASFFFPINYSHRVEHWHARFLDGYVFECLSFGVCLEQIIRKWKQEECFDGKDNYVDCVPLIRSLSRQKMPHVAQELLLEMKSNGLLPSNSTLSALMLCHANNGLFPQAEAIWDEMLHSSFVPSIQVVSELFDAYGNVGCFEKVNEILAQIRSRNLSLFPEVYSLAISCFGKGGQLELMEGTLKEMISRGFPLDSATGNAFIRYYSIFGSLTEMETAYGRLKRSRFLIEEEGIRAMSFAYLKKRKFYRLAELLKNVGLGRRNLGNLSWNLLLLSYAADFKMKGLQREFLRMVEAGFHPDLTTFNIRALAFSRMSLLWDLHLSLEHMKHEKVVPDLVTCGCVVDAYLERRLGKNFSDICIALYCAWASLLQAEMKLDIGDG
ncbi:pentatricopeptide repeat-containing protein [Prunus yedoensis var. nudiflora]|uniref:Pentatricopeptide repeat-containing protein n=1 Tax=Prunus yedoensis var. nudiflora TaxID=2094558 RepID=A0A314Z1H4_PRUYE|nr:pentatricopeptide repeat-containing protein [Prunus yedoensis var. nudiflora]